jgi:biofilm PGA synthesis N-glycosyltransferase PgaC
MVTLPFAAISVLLPMLFLPFIYLMLLVIAATQGLSAVLFYFALFTVGQVVSALVGVALARERPIHLLVAPLYRLIYEPLRAYVVYRSVLMILRGTKAGWNKLERTGAVSLALLD